MPKTQSSLADSLAARSASGPRRRQLSEEVAAYVREMIVSGEIRQGEHLRMEPIAEAVGVSNTPVREGLLLLRNEGFVRLLPRRGFVVAPFTRQDVSDIFWAQSVLAGELAARAATRMTDQGLDQLEALNTAYTQAIEDGDTTAVADLGHQFHRAINLAADSHRLATLQGAIVKNLPNRFYTAIEGQVSDSHHEHPHILEALRARDAEAARDLMATHVGSAASRLIEMLERRGLWDDTDEA